MNYVAINKKISALVPIALLFVAGPSQAFPLAVETFESGANGWLDVSSAAPTYNATGGHDGGAYISYVGNIATNTAAFGSALINFRCEFGNGCVDGTAGGPDFGGDWLAQGVTSFSYWFKHDSDIALEAFLRIAPISGVGGGGASAITGVMVAPNTWTQITVSIDPSSFDSAFGGGNYNTIFQNVGRLQPGIFFDFGTVYSETGVTFAVDDVQLNAVPIPGAVWLMASGLGLLGWFKRKSGMKAAA